MYLLKICERRKEKWGLGQKILVRFRSIVIVATGTTI